MLGKIVGVQYTSKGAFVHISSLEKFDDDQREGFFVEKVFVKKDSHIFNGIEIGRQCYVQYNKVEDKYYSNLRF